uniref:Uncharacterized protein n=1 Tax=Ananas comosus var. bracteatus TaxID=296719 RepID=A0A6V7P6D2_ANACO|nr:unnamed protein product [Ananas comosus var. bracteatus]
MRALFHWESNLLSLDGSKQIAAKGIKNQSKRVKISDSSREERCSDLTMRHNSKQISLSGDRRAWSKFLLQVLYRKCTASIMSDITKLRRIVESKGWTPIALEHNRRLLDLVIEPTLKLMELTCALPRDEAQDSMKAMDEGYIIVSPSMRHSDLNRDQLLFSFSPPLFHLSVTPKPTESKCKLNPKDQIPLPFPPSNPRFEAKTDLDLDLSCRFEITGSLIY